MAKNDNRRLGKVMEYRNSSGNRLGIVPVPFPFKKTVPSKDSCSSIDVVRAVKEGSSHVVIILAAMSSRFKQEV